MVGLEDDDAVASFINALAERVVHRDAESVFDSRIVFVIGSSGTGKTTLATKIAAYFKEHGISDRMVLAAAARSRYQRQRGHQILRQTAKHARRTDWNRRSVDRRAGNKQPYDH